MKTFLITFFLLALFSSLNSQTSEWIDYSQNHKYAQCIASEGNDIWIGTNGAGLMKFDRITGKKTSYKTDKISRHNMVNSIVIDKHGIKWLGTDIGMVQFDGGNWKSYSYFNSFNEIEGVVRDVAIDSQGNKWIASARGVLKFDGTNFTEYNSSNSQLPHNRVVAISVDDKGTVWAGTWNYGIARFDGQTWTIYNQANSELNSDFIADIFAGTDGSIWIGYTQDKAMQKFDGSNWTRYDVGAMRSFVIAPDGVIWVSTAHSLVKLNGNTREDFLDDVTTVSADKMGNIIAGTYDGLIYNISGSTTTSLRIANSPLDKNDVKVLYVDRQNNIWIGRDTGLMMFDGTDWIIFNTENSGLAANSITAITQDQQDNMYFGTRTGKISRYDGSNWVSWDVAVSPYARIINSMTFDSHSILWAATEGRGLARYDGQNWTYLNPSNSMLISDLVRAIVIDQQGNKWIGSYGCLIKDDGQSSKIYFTGNSGLPSDDITALAIDSSGNKWIGTRDGGLAKLDMDNNWVVYNSSNSPLPDNWITTINIDSKGNKWIGTLLGLLKFDDINWTTYHVANIVGTTYGSDWINSVAFDKYKNKWIAYGGLAVYNEGGIISSVNTPVAEQPSDYTLLQNYPNPFNPVTTINYKIAEAGMVTLKVFNLIGQEIATLVNGQKTAGEYTVQFDAANLTSGIYFYRLTADGKVYTRKMIVLK